MTESGGIENGQRQPHADKGSRRPRVRMRRHAAWVALAAAVFVAGVSAWQSHPGRWSGAPMFPRLEAEFLPATELDRRLAQAESKLKADPTDIGALTESGVLLFQKGADHYPEAINELEEARRLGAIDTRIFYYLGVMYQQEGLYPFAEAEYQKFLRNRPEDVDVRLLLAKLQYQGNQYDDAAAQYRQLLGVRPKDPLIMENLGLSLWRLKRRDEAIQILTQLAAQDAVPGLRAHFYLGQMAFEDKDYKQALRRYAIVLPVADSPAMGIAPEIVHASLAANFEKLKLFKEAKEHWEKVLQHNPQQAQAKAGLKAADAALKAMVRAASKRKPRHKK